METREYKIFYSWQSDRRDFKSHIEKSLNKAIKTAQEQLKLPNHISLKESANGKRGAVDIAKTIFERIDSCDLFVADMSIVDETKQRKYVNQNVIHELGYMMGKHGNENVVLLFNTDTGKIEDLPFDIRNRKTLIFSIDADASGTVLTSELSHILKMYLKKWVNQRSKEDELSEYEQKIMDFFKSMPANKRIILAKDLSGSQLVPLNDEYDEEILDEINDDEDMQRKNAALESLVGRGLLSKENGDKNQIVFGLTENGYKSIGA